jgi:hypothetical protein
MIINYEELLGKLISHSENILQNGELSEVKHYYEHDEYEMALEGLLIELISTGKYPVDFKYSEWEEIVIHYGLNTESVFDGDIWNKFALWGKSR